MWASALGVFLALLASSYLGFAARVTAEVDVPAPPLTDVHILPGEMTTFTYCTPDHAGLAMDFYAPPATANRPAPVLLQIHGGVGIYGDRKDILIPPAQDLTTTGFAVASIDYRRAPMVLMASQVEDAQCAVRFLRANASALGIDPERIGAFGHSEGGWLSAMLGLAGPRAGAESLEYQGYSSQVQAVVDEAGPADLPRLLREGPIWMGQAAFVLYRGQPVSTPPDNSSVDYVQPGAPPFLIVQGTDDEVIPFQQSAELAGRLQAFGDEVRFVAVQGGPHDLKAPTQVPDQSQLGHIVNDFFVGTLYPAVP
ncbi:MAG: alpha/beta hydrolase [Chloroflexi bacterium]|nr:alpha/beta hydrolase [Chloroflexota bacterium]